MYLQNNNLKKKTSEFKVTLKSDIYLHLHSQLHVNQIHLAKAEAMFYNSPEINPTSMRVIMRYYCGNWSIEVLVKHNDNTGGCSLWCNTYVYKITQSPDCIL